MAAYWTYAPWAVNTLALLGAWRYVPLTVIRLVAAFTETSNTISDVWTSTCLTAELSQFPDSQL